MIADIFAGPGGWDEGAKAFGLHPVGYEWGEAACATAVAAGHQRVRTDVAAVDVPSLDGLITSPPCQGFSPSGKGRGRVDAALLLQVIPTLRDPNTFEMTLDALREHMSDDRSLFVLEPLRWALQGQPQWMAWEQVPAVLPIWEACAIVLRDLGWHVWTGILSAEAYGVPQTRKRAFLTAHRDHEVGAPVPTHSRYHSRSPERIDEGMPRWVSMAEALSRDPQTVVQRSNYSAGGGQGTTAAERGRTIRTLDQPSVTLTSKGFQWQPTTAVEGDTSWVDRRPSPTIVGSFSPDVVAAPGYRKAGDPPRQKTPGSVRVTVQEAAVLQSFRPDYPWQGSRGQQYQQVGDAVPPLLAEHVLRSVLT